MQSSAMANPWLKQNLLMSMWLSNANRIVGAVGGRAVAETKRQAALATQQAVNEIVKFWAVATPAPTNAATVVKRRKGRK